MCKSLDNMFISGQFYNFENRLHQLPLTTGDLANFVTEGNTYLGLGNLTIHESGHIEQEARLKFYQMTKSGIFLNSGRFNAFNFSGKLILDRDGYQPWDLQLSNIGANQDYIFNNSGFVAGYLIGFTGDINELNLNTNQLNTFIINTPNAAQLQILNITGNQLTSFVTNCNIQDTLNLSHNLLTSIAITGMPNLQQFNASFNHLTTVNLSGIYNLDGLQLNNNLFTNINLVDNIAIPPGFDMSDINLSNNLFSSQTVDSIISQVSTGRAISNGTLNLTGNSKPTSTSLSARASLSGASWTILLD